MLGQGDITPWMPEPHTVLHQALGKLAEEAAELAKIAVRCTIQGLDEQDPGTGEWNRRALCNELSDVFAVLQWIKTICDVDVFDDRVERKFEGFLRWEEMITQADQERLGQQLEAAQKVLIEAGAKS